MKKLISILLIIAFVAGIFIIVPVSCKKDSKPSDPPVVELKIPTVSTYTVSSITTNGANVSASVLNDGGSPVTVRGFCYSTAMNPTIADNVTSNGTGTGSFTGTLSGLYQGTGYYVRAYATNSKGTAYGSNQFFTTGYVALEPSYFPIAVWLQDPKKNAMGYKNNGINTFMGLWNPLDETQLTAIKNAGLKVICSQNEYGLSIGNEPAVIGWMHGDEPDNAQANGSGGYNPCISPSIIINDYNTWKQKDPTRPVYINLGQGVAYTNYIGRGTCRNNLDTYKVSTNGYLVGCDIASFDIYPVNNTDATTSNKLEYVAIGIQNLINWSGNKPAWCWIESTRIHDSSPRRPTTKEVRSEVWMGLIHGAKGFGYFCHSFVTGAVDEAAMLHDAEMIDAIKQINAQVTNLAIVLNSQTTTGYATVTSSNSGVPVDIMTKNYGNANYVFAIAMRSGDTTAEFTVTSGNSVEVLGEGRSLTVSNGKFSDSFSPYQVHLYKITTN